ncbi:MAG TPA: NAD-dependent epimerase/dehydratase family protein [Vicinamibacterales bacterium]|nr:NAD-dependent epimerase/dehydratase family protein [Vicinamibacterales bacterium]
MSRYFVTGATGFLGGELVKQLIGRGHLVAALVRSTEKATLLSTLGAELHVGDITDRNSLRAPMDGADGVFHTAAWYKVGAPASVHLAAPVNVQGTRNVLETARDLKIPRVVYTSTVGVFGNTHGRLVDETYYAAGPFLTEYDRTKWLAHYEVAVPLAEAGLPLVIVMPGAIYGPGDTSGLHTTLAQLLRGRLFVTPRGVSFCWGYVEDVARGLRQAMDAGRPGESYLLTGPVHTFEDAFALAARLARKRAPFFHPRPVTMRAAAALSALLERWEIQPPIPAETLRLMAGTTWIGSCAKAEKELGWTARPLDEGLRHTIEHELRQLGMA